MSGWREVWSLPTPPFSAACWSGGARRRSWPSDWGLEYGASLLLRSRGGLLLPTAGKRVTPPGSGRSFPLQGQGYLDPGLRVRLGSVIVCTVSLYVCLHVGLGIRRHLSGDISGPPGFGGPSPPTTSPAGGRRPQTSVRWWFFVSGGGRPGTHRLTPWRLLIGAWSLGLARATSGMGCPWPLGPGLGHSGTAGCRRSSRAHHCNPPGFCSAAAE
ncbi:hypothetical protein ACER0C_027081 [Sarotherodon galilaeus]